MLIQILPFLAFVGILYFLITSKSRKYKKQPTFEEYKEKHPNLVSNGKIQCSSCGGKDIFVRRVFAGGSKEHNIHLCKSCGKSLYRSTTEI
jgi:hypothetical protein